MPVYEFRCKDCNHEFQELFSSYEVHTEDVECPSCRKRHAEKLLSVFAADARNSADTPSVGPCGAHCGCHHN